MSQKDTATDPQSGDAREATDRVFGAENRARLLSRYFASQETVTPANAWQHVYRLLLWIDRTTALAHCYESDKAQPGRAWYERSLAFHDWMSRALGVEPAGLGDAIDWLFREAITDLAGQAVASRGAAYERQRAPYAGRGVPEPGEDPELAGIIRDMLAPWLNLRPPDDALRNLTRRIHAHLNQENKRRNLVGEGFEDVIAAVVSRLPGAGHLQVRNRALLHDLPGFHQPAPTDKDQEGRSLDPRPGSEPADPGQRQVEHPGRPRRAVHERFRSLCALGVGRPGLRIYPDYE